MKTQKEDDIIDSSEKKLLSRMEFVQTAALGVIASNSLSPCPAFADADNDKTFVHYKNSCDDNLEKYYRISGETIYNKQGKAFFHHMGRGATKPERLLDWIDFWENNKQ